VKTSSAPDKQGNFSSVYFRKEPSSGAAEGCGETKRYYHSLCSIPDRKNTPDEDGQVSDSEPLRQNARNDFGRFRSETHARIEVIGACPPLSRREKDIEDGPMSARLRAAPDAQQALVFLYNVPDQ
jgi:hypothetical protein